MQNRNVVPRGRPRVVQPPGRDAARTIEFDCRAVANLLDQQTPKPPDLDAEIEVVAAAAERARAARDRFAHTMRRAGAELKVEGSQPMPRIVEGSRPALPLAAPPITEEEIEDETDTQEDVSRSATTRAMDAFDEPSIELPQPAPRPRRRNAWALPFALALVAASAGAIVAALI